MYCALGGELILAVGGFDEISFQMAFKVLCRGVCGLWKVQGKPVVGRVVEGGVVVP